MKTLASIVCLLFFFLTSIASDNNDSKVFSYTEIEPAPDLSSFIEIYRDPSQKTTIDQILNSTNPLQFRLNEQEDMNFGFDPDALWLKLPVLNPSDSLRHGFFQIKSPTLNDVQFYLVKDRQVVSRQEAGTDHQLKDNDIENIYPSFDLKLEKATRYDFYCRIKSNTVKIVPLVFYTTRQNAHNQLGNLLFELLLLGFVVGFGTFNIVLYYMIRERMYLFLGLVCIFLFLIFSTHYGCLFVFDLGLPVFLKERMLFISLSISYLFFSLLGIDYLNIKKLEKYWLQLVRFFLIVCGINLLFSLLPFVPYWLISRVFLVSYSIAWIFFLIVSLRAAQTDHRPALYFFIAIALFLTVTLIYFLFVFGFIPYNPLYSHLIPIVACIDTVILTMGLSQVITFNSEEKRKAVMLEENNAFMKHEIELRLVAEQQLWDNQQELELLYKKQSSRLAEKENHFKYLVENLSDWVWQINRKKKFTHNNYKLLKLLEYHHDELFDQPFLQLVEPADHEKIHVAFTQCLSKGKGFIDLPVVFISRNHELIPMEISGEAIRDYDHHIIGIMGISCDLRPRQLSERILLKAIHGAEEKERNRMSLEIHDGIGPILSGIYLYLSTLLSENSPPEKQMILLQKARQSVQEVSNEMRHIANNLMPVEFINRSLSGNIALLVSRLLSNDEIACLLSVEDFTINLTKEQNLVIYRIISELLANSIKHSSARNIQISLWNDQTTVKVSYADDGIGFDLDKKLQHSNGMGLHNIQSRLTTIDAIHQFKSSPGKGMSLAFSFKKNTIDTN